MAKAVDTTVRVDGEVSSCVSNLIHAFTNGLDVFKRLRERRRRRKSRKHKGHSDEVSGAELELSNSLRRGPLDIKESYERNYDRAGERFAKGDAIAHASLAETLIKLNTGLVGIIASFLNHDSKSHHLNLDYKSLTNLSEASRAEAVESLNHLCQRLGQSQLQVYRIQFCPQCGSSKHQNCSGGIMDRKSYQAKGHQHKRTRSRSRARSKGPTIERIPIKRSSNKQLAVVRPRNTRKSSTSSSSSSSSRAQSMATNSPPGSPLPQYSPTDPYSSQKYPTKPSPAPGRRRGSSIDGPRPTTWPHTHQIPNFVPPIPPKLPPVPPKIPVGRSPPPREKHTPSPGIGPVVRRRVDKPTPSTFTFASDSTKLGEIPQRNWTTPWDYEEAERLNAEAAMNGYPAPVVEKPKVKKGLFSFLRRGTMAN